MDAPFDTVRFADPEQAESLLRSLAMDEALSRVIADALAMTGSPERALVRLRHFLEGAESPDDERERIAADREYAAMLCTVFDQSQLMTDAICNDRGLLPWLRNDVGLRAQRSRREMLSAYEFALGHEADLRRRMAQMRQSYRRELVRIGIRDVYVHAPVDIVTRELSELADTMAAAALSAAESELTPRYGMPMHGDNATRATMTVLGMGKLGGRELNFSSDIDLIFVYSEDGDCSGGTARELTNGEYFTKLGELFIKALTEDSAAGRVYRVDMRLRPHGSMAPLALSLARTVEYFESQGRPWERQALIKARPIAGDIAIGDAFLDEIRPFVFPKYFDDATLEDIRAVKTQMESQVADRGETESEVKLGRGGIRDIEFTVQMLQLLNGGRNAALRVRNTLAAIEQLGRHGFLSPFDAQTLASNYCYLREIEHRLQIEGGQQRHALPESPEALADFAMRLGYASAEAFMQRYRERGTQTRRILEAFFDTEGAGNLWVNELLQRDSVAAEGLQRLERIGFQDPKGAREELLDLYLGPDIRPHSAHIRQAFRSAAPILLEQLARAPRPDETLLRVGRLLTNLKAPRAMYDLLSRRPALCEALVTVISNSYYLADIVIRNPELFDFFGQHAALEKPATWAMIEHELTILRDAREPEAALYRLHEAMTLRVGLRELLGHADVVAVGHELSMLADVCLQAVYDACAREARARFGEADIEMAILGVGKLGGQEMGYGSDLDLVFVYRGSGTSDVSAVEFSTAIATALMRRMKERTSLGVLYDVDARLRPDGQKGPLTVSEDRFRDYYEGEAQGWERLVMVKARGVAGDWPFTREMEETALNCAYARALTEVEITHTDDMRRRLSESAGALDLKRGEGGLAELEFGLRLLQLRHAKENPELRRADALGAIGSLLGCGLLSEGDAEVLRDAYLGIRRVENRIRMFEGRPSSALPEDEDMRRELAARLGMDGDIAEAVGRWKAGVHEVYARILARA